ncbi:hypothetical protein B0H11DRAFT_2074499 [Mycena galericulata]|nr:hypothetical protein B0H11DRAFT_2074499 [Mycena galericulata]
MNLMKSLRRIWLALAFPTTRIRSRGVGNYRDLPVFLRSWRRTMGKVFPLGFPTSRRHNLNTDGTALRRLILSVLRASLAQVAPSYTSATFTNTNTRRFTFDTDGNQVDTYVGSKINFLNGKYSLYGNAFGPGGYAALGIKSYSSTDFRNWSGVIVPRLSKTREYEFYPFNP